MHVIITNSQIDLALTGKKKPISQICNFILKNLNRSFDSLSLFFVSEEKISSLHKSYFKDSSPTDCISFPIDSEFDPKPTVLGEIFICPKTALKYGRTHKIDPYEELTLYIVHGLLHLLGYDDIKKSDRSLMQKKQKEIMNELKIAKLMLKK
jgi:probable rRNA maturation factor